jgi:hypothetical protein
MTARFVAVRGARKNEMAGGEKNKPAAYPQENGFASSVRVR